MDWLDYEHDLPEFSKCIVCKAGKKDKKATWAVIPKEFIKAIKDERIFHELGQTERKAANDWAHHVADPIGGTKPRPLGTKHLKDTAGIAFKYSGGRGFDALFLCDAHYDEMKKAL